MALNKDIRNVGIILSSLLLVSVGGVYLCSAHKEGACQWPPKSWVATPLNPEQQKIADELVEDIREHTGIEVKYGTPANYQFSEAPWMNSYMQPKNQAVSPADPNNIIIAIEIIKEEISKYPEGYLSNFIKDFFISGYQKSGKQDVLGQVLPGVVILSSCVLADGKRVKKDFRATIHHEISSFAFWGNEDQGIHKESSFEKAWLSNNGEKIGYQPHGVIYNKEFMERIKNTFDGSIEEQGFVRDYGLTNMENDFNTYAELVWTDPERMQKLADKYPRIRRKLALFVQRYIEADPAFRDILPKFKGLEVSQ